LGGRAKTGDRPNDNEYSHATGLQEPRREIRSSAAL
jgi:hypothetical protein